MTFRKSNNPLQEAGETLNTLLEQNKDNDVLLMFSGGSALGLLDDINPKLVGSKTTITVLDERYGVEDKDSNYAQLLKTDFGKVLQVKNAQFLNPQTKEDASLQEAGEMFNQALHTWQQAYPDGVVIITQGIGPDGHTSGVLPSADPEKFEQQFNQQNLWAIGYEVLPEVNPHTKRITTTLSFLRDIVSHAIVFAAGDNKKEALYDVQDDDGDLATTPARIIRDQKNATIFTDQEI